MDLKRKSMNSEKLYSTFDAKRYLPNGLDVGVVLTVALCVVTGRVVGQILFLS